MIDIQKAIYAKEKLYLWYVDAKNFKTRVDLEFKAEVVAAELFTKLKYILEAEKRPLKCIDFFLHL